MNIISTCEICNNIMGWYSLIPLQALPALECFLCVTQKKLGGPGDEANGIQSLCYV